ncbi:hypothetical protein FH972_025843 [Carpinus fangiana]|uniref:Uncharacterized protein n=1 Tax=Carpinus fangiana TaxID=176857 RepID=A0A5N6L271_9ROSI|nr:hypothetical protein FH972_025843 [Carpinus fangiana]
MAAGMTPVPITSKSWVLGTGLGVAWVCGNSGVLIDQPVTGAQVDPSEASFTHAQAFAGTVITGGAGVFHTSADSC